MAHDNKENENIQHEPSDLDASHTNTQSDLSSQMCVRNVFYFIHIPANENQNSLK